MADCNRPRTGGPLCGVVWALVALAGLMWATGAAAREFRLGVEADYGPFVYMNAAGQAEGLSIDMLTLVRKYADLPVRTMAPRPLNQLLELARRGELDLLTSLRPTPERAGYLLFSLPYVRVPAVLVVHDGRNVGQQGAPLQLDALNARPVALGAGYAVESFVRERHPEVAWKAVADDVVALRGLIAGHYDAAVVDAASLAFIAKHHGLRGLTSAGGIGFDYTLSFAVRKDLPELLATIDAGIRAIPAAERTAVVERWLEPLDVPEQSTVAVRAAMVAAVLVGIGGVAALAAWWRRQHARQRNS